jgi:hypothetical protein
MSISKQWRGVAAGLILSVAAIGTVATPSQAADVRFGIVLTDRDHRPSMRYERVPVAPRHYERTDWRPGYWQWHRNHWEWNHGRFDHRRGDRDYDHRGRW